MHVLVFSFFCDGRHAFHPEVVEECTYDMQCTFETYFNLEAVPVKFNNLAWSKGKVSGHQYHFSPCGVGDGDKLNKYAHRTPQQVERPDVQLHVRFAVDRAWDGVHEVFAFKEAVEFHLFSVHSGPSLFPDVLFERGQIGDGVASHTRDQVAPCFKRGAMIFFEA